MNQDEIVATIRKKYERACAVLDERGRRGWAVVEAEALGNRGQSIVAKATGLSGMTLYAKKSGSAIRSGGWWAAGSESGGRTQETD